MAIGGAYKTNAPKDYGNNDNIVIPPEAPRGPTDQHRTIVIGRTGSGKSQFAISLLASRDYDVKPWVIIDYKGEDLIDDIRLATGGRKRGAIKWITPYDDPPHKPGLYYMRPRIGVDDDAVNKFLYRCYDEKRGPLGDRHRGHIGLFVDEGYALPQSPKGPFDQILVQGRTLHIPVIVLYQRPVWMSRFAVAQSDFRAHFTEDDDRDLKVSSQFFKKARGPNGEEISVFTDLPQYWCLWYDVSKGLTTVLRPAPDRQLIIKTFQRRLSPSKTRALI